MPNRLLSFDELNNLFTTTMEEALTAVEVAVINGIPDGKFDRKRIEDIIFDLLTMYYALGWRETGLSLGEDIRMSESLQQDAVLAKTAGKTAFERIDEHITAAEDALKQGGGVEAASRLTEQIRVVADTDGHRVMETSGYEAAESYAQKHPDKAVYKTWVTMNDDRVRDTHFYLEGVTVPIDARFYTYDGDSALYPGGFEYPQNVVNCRCKLKYSTI